ncbi:MAG: VWA domain-containing protein [Candidatus Promineifilaceae bacterium]|nr:VWA domain-containing protein [Candidatus Promineifilaceae bacterium]
MSFQQSNYYQVLGLNPDASISEISEAFDRLRAQLAHDESDAADSDLSFLRHVYEVLSNPQRRTLYDSLLEDVSSPKLDTLVQISGTNLGLLSIPQIVYLLVEIRSAKNSKETLRPLNLSIVIDCSTSMRGERLEQVKNGLFMLLEKLSGGDVLSVVSFSDRAQVILPSRRLGEQKEPTAAIQAIQASGGTEIFQGLSAGVGQISQVSLKEYNNHLILLTDGHTYGDEDKCLRLGAKLAGEGIILSAFGIGSDWDDKFLDALVEYSGGTAEYIATEQDIVSSLERRVQGVGTVFANQVQLLAEWPRAVELLDIFRLTPIAQPMNSDTRHIQLGAIEGNTPLRFLLEFRLLPQPIPTRVRIPLKMVAEIPGQGEHQLEEIVDLSIMQDGQQVEPPPDIIRAVRLLTLYRLNERAWHEMETGHFDKAVTSMKHLSTRFLEAGEPALAKQARIEAQRLSQGATLSLDGHKNLKYGTRVLMRKAIQLDWDDSM